MRACKKDLNHDEIANIFRANNYKIIDTFKCHGVLLDFIAYKEGLGIAWHVEVKNGNNGILTKNEVSFIVENPNVSIVLRSKEDAMEFCRKTHLYTPKIKEINEKEIQKYLKSTLK